MNPALAGVFPQFKRGEKLQNVYSFAEVERRVQEYLVSALNGTVTGGGEIMVRGKHQEVLSRVRQLQPLIESFFNSTPKVVSALCGNVPLYLPYATQNEIKNITTTAGKIKAMQAVLDNLQYNTDLGALNSIKHESPAQFVRNKRKWEAKVGYRRLKKI